MADRKSLRRYIQELEFALIETGLYLDAYDSSEAVAFYNETKTALEKAVRDYERLYGPLTPQNAAESGKWLWTEAPWPWESEAN